LASLKRKFGETKHKFDEVNLRLGQSAFSFYHTTLAQKLSLLAIP
jgi:hypothetical protein